MVEILDSGGIALEDRLDRMIGVVAWWDEMRESILQTMTAN